MRLSEFNNITTAPGEKKELPYSKDDPNRLEYIPLIEKHCSDALSDMRKVRKPLYRGFRNAPSGAFVGSPRNKWWNYLTSIFIMQA